MPTKKSLTVQELAECRLFDRAIELYQKERRAAADLDEKIERELTRLNNKREELGRKINGKKADIKKLLAELQELSDGSSFGSLVEGLFGSDSGKGDVSDPRRTLLLALRREVMDQTILVLLKSWSSGDDDDVPTRNG